MQSDLEKESLSLKMHSNSLNSRAMALVISAELVQEYRSTVQHLLALIDKLQKSLNEKENFIRNGGAVPAPAQSLAGKDSNSPAGAGVARDQEVSGPSVERHTG
jgi:uncharacterized hydantoinase/oxoprolinase family protein